MKNSKSMTLVMNEFIPVNEPCFAGNEKKYLSECIDSGWISSEGPFVKKFESTYAKYLNVEYGLAVSSGTAAIETALYALGVKKGDEVIMPSFTIISCAIACLRLGAKPVLVDIEPDTWTMDVSQVEGKITDKTKVVMPVHMYGHAVDMDQLFILKEKYGFLILEDAAEVHGAEYYSKYKGNKWLKCGAMGDIAATSFYANKIISTGEGGMVLTDNKYYADRAATYRNLCFSPERRFLHTDIGYNFRMTNMQAAVGLAQLEQIEEFINRKRHIATLYKKEISALQGIHFMQVKSWAKSVFWMYCVILEKETDIDANKMMTRLKQHNVDTRPFFCGLHEQPALSRQGLFLNESYPHTSHASKYGFYLPSSITLTNEQILRITDALKKGLN